MIELTEREYEILELLCNGVSTNEMAEVLFIAPSTVKTHISALMQKTQQKSRLKLVLWAVKGGKSNVTDRRYSLG